MKKIIVLLLSLMYLSGCDDTIDGNKVSDFYNSELEITLYGESAVSIEYCQIFEDEGFEAYYKEEDVTQYVEVTYDFDTCVPGTYDVHYFLDYDDKEVEVYRTVIVGQDPGITLTLTGKKEVTVEMEQDYIDSGVVAYDNYTKQYLTSNVLVSGEVDNMSIGTYTIYYSITVRGIEYTSSRIVVVTNISSITISLVGKQYGTMSIYDNYVELGATATSKYLDLTEYLTIENNITLYNSGVYTVTYSVTYSGVSSTKIRTVEITTPVVTFDLNGEEHIYVMNSETYSESGYTAYDNTNKLDISEQVVEHIEYLSINEYTISYTLEYDNSTYILYRYVLKIKYESIKTPEDFINMDMDTDYILFNDIDFTDVDLTQFTLDSKVYNGELNGNGYSFSNMLITLEEDISLFNSITNKIHNIVFSNMNFTSSNSISLLSKNCYGTLDNITLSNVTITTSNYYGICENMYEATNSNINISNLYVSDQFKFMPLHASTENSTYKNIVIEVIVNANMFTVLEESDINDLYENVHIIIDDESDVFTFVPANYSSTDIIVYSNFDFYCYTCIFTYNEVFYDEDYILETFTNDLWSFDYIHNVHLLHIKEYN